MCFIGGVSDKVQTQDTLPRENIPHSLRMGGVCVLRAYQDAVVDVGGRKVTP